MEGRKTMVRGRRKTKRKTDGGDRRRKDDREEIGGLLLQACIEAGVNLLRDC